MNVRIWPPTTAPKSILCMNSVACSSWGKREKRKTKKLKKKASRDSSVPLYWSAISIRWITKRFRKFDVKDRKTVKSVCIVFESYKLRSSTRQSEVEVFRKTSDKLLNYVYSQLAFESILDEFDLTKVRYQKQLLQTTKLRDFLTIQTVFHITASRKILTSRLQLEKIFRISHVSYWYVPAL